MKEIIAPVDRELLKSELTPDKRLRSTNKSNNEIYIVNWKNAPNTLQEIGRLREIAFRAAGGGTGEPVDLDEYDLMENPYQQLIVWNPEAEEILGGYRYLLGNEVEFDEHGHPILATAHMFNFSEKFLKEYLPTTIELGRSFVTLEYQSTRAGSKGLFALDNLWDGLGALTVVKPNVKYLFGKMTMYPNYSRFGRDMILYFLKKHFTDKDNLITPMEPLKIETDEAVLKEIFCYDAIGQRLHESLAYDAYVRHRYQRWIRHGGGNRHPDCGRRDIRGKACTPHRILPSRAPRSIAINIGSQSGCIQRYGESLINNRERK